MKEDSRYSEVREIVESHSGELLSKRIVRERSANGKHWYYFVRVKCNAGHIWRANIVSLRTGSWCAECFAERLRIPFTEIVRACRKRGGKCISKSAKKSSSKITVQCSEGHTFETNYNKVQQGRWCPTCRSGISERAVRHIVEELFGAEFPSTWPDWLRKRGALQGLQLDGYNKTLNIAFEYQGIQHYQFIPYIHRTRENYRALRRRDRWKQQKCVKMGVLLIVIPHQENLSNLLDHVRSHVESTMKKNRRKLPIGFWKKRIDIADTYLVSALGKYRKIADEKGGELLSSRYRGAHAEYRWRCKEGHVWTAPGVRITSGSWCRKCSYIERAKTIVGPAEAKSQ